MPCRGGGKNSGRAVGEIGEALPVAEEASRFRGSAPIGGHDSDRESVGTTVGNRRPLRRRILWCVGEGLCPSRGRPQGSPLRKRYKGCRGERNPPVTASPRQSPLGKGTEGTGETDCHGRCAHRPRNDTFSRSAVQARAGRCRRSPLRDHFGFIYIGKFIFPGQKRNIYEYII